MHNATECSFSCDLAMHSERLIWNNNQITSWQERKKGLAYQPPSHGIVDLLSQKIMSAIAGQQYHAKEVEGL